MKRLDRDIFIAYAFIGAAAMALLLLLTVMFFINPNGSAHL